TRLEDVIHATNGTRPAANGSMVFDISRHAVCVRYSEGWRCKGPDGRDETFYDPGAVLPSTYIKASNTDAGDGFRRVSLSADGNTLAVGAPGEDSNATGINGNQDNN